MTPPDTCPNCGAEVPRNARACPGCGSDETTGWSDEAYASGLGLPDDEFNYEEFRRREFGGGSIKPPRLGWIWWAAGVLLLLAFLAFILRLS